MKKAGLLGLSLWLMWSSSTPAQPIPTDLDDPRYLHDLLGRAKARRLEQRFNVVRQYGIADMQYGYDVSFYGLDLKVDPVERLLTGRVEIRGRITAAGEGPGGKRDILPVDLYNNMTVTAVNGDAKQVQHNGHKLLVRMAPKAVGETFSIIIEYQGRPLETGFLAFAFREHQGMPIIATLSEPYFARVWWPCKDVPSDKADSARIKITVPRFLYAVSNGKLMAITESDGWRTFEWYERFPIAAYLISLAITNYQIYQDWYVNSDGDSLEVPYYLYPEDYNAGLAGLSETPEMLRVFERLFGPYPFPGEKYGQAQFPWPGGMEHQTATSLCCFGRSLVAHELAHQWWGDMITCANWQHIWLNEGFASYSEALYVEAKSGISAYRDYMNRMASNFAGRLFVDDTTHPGRIFARIVYHKGAWVLHMLRGLLGDETFFAVLRAYASDPDLKYGVATTEDFQRVAERVSGHDLSRFFRQWVYSPGMPRYLYAWSSVKSGNRFQITLRIKQEQKDTTTFSMPIRLRIEYPTGQQELRLDNSRRCQTYILSLDQQPRRILLDPDDWILKTAAEVPFEMLSSRCEVVPLSFQLKPVTPNPVRWHGVGTTVTFRFVLDAAGPVNLRIFNMLGQEVAALLQHRFLEPGSYSTPWNGLSSAGVRISSGVYFAVLEHRNRIARRKFLVVN